MQAGRKTPAEALVSSISGVCGCMSLNGWEIWTKYRGYMQAGRKTPAEALLGLHVGM